MTNATRNHRQARHQASREVRYVVVDNITFACGVVMVIMALIMFWNVGSMCQKARMDGLSQNVASAKVQADEQAYARGYADAQWDLARKEAAA